MIDDEADHASVNTKADYRGRRTRRPIRRINGLDPRPARQVRAERLRRLHRDAVRQHPHRPGGRAPEHRRGSLPAQLHLQAQGPFELRRARRRCSGSRADPSRTRIARRAADRHAGRRGRGGLDPTKHKKDHARAHLPASLMRGPSRLHSAVRRATGARTDARAQLDARPRDPLRRRAGARLRAALDELSVDAATVCATATAMPPATSSATSSASCGNGLRAHDRGDSTGSAIQPMSLGGGRAGTRCGGRRHRGRCTINGTATDALEYYEHPEGSERHRHRRRQALTRTDARGALGLVFPPGLEDVRHAHADGAWFGYHPATSTYAGLYLTPSSGWFGDITARRRS